MRIYLTFFKALAFLSLFISVNARAEDSAEALRIAKGLEPAERIRLALDIFDTIFKSDHGSSFRIPALADSLADLARSLVANLYPTKNAGVTPTKKDITNPDTVQFGRKRPKKFRVEIDTKSPFHASDLDEKEGSDSDEMSCDDDDEYHLFLKKNRLNDKDTIYFKSKLIYPELKPIDLKSKKIHSTINLISKHKETFKMILRENLNAKNKSYVGKSTQALKKRTKQHAGDINNLSKVPNRKARYCHKQGFLWVETIVRNAHPDELNWLEGETIYFLGDENSLNSKNGKIKTPNKYTMAILDKLRNKLLKEVREELDAILNGPFGEASRGDLLDSFNSSDSEETRPSRKRRQRS